MKRILPSIQIAFLVITAFFFMSNRGGTPGGRTGSPTDGTSCGTNGGCHGSSQGAISQDFLSSDITTDGYEPGKTHTITVSPSLDNRNTWGFEIVAEDGNGNPVGEFLNTADANSLRNGQRATHKFASSTGTGGRTWTVEWTAPAAGTGDVTFYAASLAANGNGNTGGDRVLLDDLAVSEGIVNSISLLSSSEIKLYPNPTVDIINVETPLKNAQIEIFSQNGKSVYAAPNQGQIDVSSLSSGVYYLKVVVNNESITKTFVKR